MVVPKKDGSRKTHASIKSLTNPRRKNPGLPKI